MRTLRYWPAALAALLALTGLVPAAVSADSAGSLRDRAAELSQRNSDLAARSRGVVLQLYALDSKLAREQARLVALRIRTADVKADLAAARAQLKAARASLQSSERSLASRLALIYEQGDTDPVAIVLGASSVADALGNLDSLNRIADQDRHVIAQVRQAKHRATRLEHRLTGRLQALAALTHEAEQSTLVLEQSRSQRASYLASLNTQQRLNAAAIESYQQRALAAEEQARQLAVAAPSPAAPPAEIGPGGKTLTVVATGYALRGHTATGIPTGWGVVAVDPSVIPLGTHLSIPGYGSGVAADTGSAVHGATIDLWFPSVGEAHAWGSRTVTISLG